MNGDNPSNFPIKTLHKNSVKKFVHYLINYFHPDQKFNPGQVTSVQVLSVTDSYI
jgi:hypothetical protein